MPTIIGHAVAAYTIERMLVAKSSTPLLMPVALISAMIPDIDVIAFKFSIPYADAFGHRGFAHSIAFSVLWSGLLQITIFKRVTHRLNSFAVIFAATCSHGLLDAATNGGLGVGFFIPFDNTRYFFPVRPIQVSPIGLTGFWERGLPVIVSESIWIGLPAVAICMLLVGIRRFRLGQERNVV